MGAFQFLLHGFVILWLRYSEFLIEIVVIDRKHHVILQCLEDIDLLLTVLALRRDEEELTALGVDAEACEGVCHLIVENIQDALLDEEVDILLTLLLDSSESLRAFVPGFGGEGVAGDGLAYLVVAIGSEFFIKVATS